MKWIKLFENFQVNENIIIPGEYIDFVQMLKDHGIDTELYGTGTFKTIGHLYHEIEEGETELTDENGQLVRRVQFVGARILYKKDGKWWRLYEEKQIFKDGRERRRTNMPYSAAEKFKSGEDPKEVIVRGMKEELNLDITKDQFVFYNKKEIENNDDYPGIKSFHIGHEFLVILNDSQFLEEGYIERQADKDVYFTWRPVEGSVKESRLFILLEKYENKL
jgi:hypothetical protein